MLDSNIRLHYNSGKFGIGIVDDYVRFIQKLNSLCTEHRFKGVIQWCFSELASIPTIELESIHLNICYYELATVDFKKPRVRSCLFIFNGFDDRRDIPCTCVRSVYVGLS